MSCSRDCNFNQFIKNIYLMNKFRGPNTRSTYAYNLEVVYTHLAIIEFILKNEYEKPQHL